VPDEESRPGHLPLGKGVEFDLVRRVLRVLGDDARGVGDDASVLDIVPDEHIVISVDSSVEDVHFREAWLTPEEIAWRATTAAVSDLAAMAARPLGLLLALTLPERWVGRLDALAEGVRDAARAAGAPVLGGDIARGTELTLSVTAIGAATRPVSRRGASDGDRVYVTGVLGGAGSAIRALTAGEEPDAWARARFARPVARVRESRWLAAQGATAMIDISDGLSSELHHLAEASAVELHVNLDRVPVASGVSPLDAVTSGEEYELVVTAATEFDRDEFSRTFGIVLTEIGIVATGHAGVLASNHGERVDLPGGHDHYSS
jgi:thiamine-monophosphate kinase